MKSGGGGSLPVKRGWRGLVMAVLGLVILSMLVPLVFLLGLHNGFHSAGYRTEDGSPASKGFRRYDTLDHNNSQYQSEGGQSAHLDDLMRRLRPALSKDVENFIKETQDEANGRGSAQLIAESKDGLPLPPDIVQKQLPDIKNEKVDGSVEMTEYVNGVIGAESEKSCQLELGSYCLWSHEHKEEMNDLMVKKLKDQLFVARAYYPSIAKLPAHDELSRELKQNIQEFERILSETTTDADLPLHIGKKLQKMEAAIAKAESLSVDCNNVDKKLRQILDLTEDEAHFHMKQSAFLYQLAVQTMPKSHHCLSMRLTLEHFRSPSFDEDLSLAEKYVNPALHHYVLFSNNILASSVVINSTVKHSNESRNLVFHILTDGQNYFAMKLWFFRNSYKEATIHVLNIENLIMDYHYGPTPLGLSLPKEFRVSFRSVDELPTQLRTEYISVFGHTHFLLPEIFQNLKKVIVLDDDIVVQRDLSPLWNLDLGGKVNGAVQFCALRLGHLKSYFSQNSFDRNSCTWMSGLNIVDLGSWREQKLTEIYQRRLQELHSIKEVSLRAGVLPASLLTFQDLIYPLNDSWVLSGLGYDYSIDAVAIRKAAVLHYNGNMKPWLELGIPKYRGFWKQFLKREDQFMGECNVNP